MMKIFNSKMAVFVILMAVVSRSYVRAIRQFSAVMDYPSTWCVFPFVMCSFSYLILFWFGVIYVNSDVPFMQHVNMYHAIRVGRRHWALGQAGGIVIRSVVLTVVAAVCTILPLFPVLNIPAMIRHKLAFFIPTVWAELARIATPDYGYYWLPSIPYMFGFLITGILCMTAIILIKVKK